MLRWHAAFDTFGLSAIFPIVYGIIEGLEYEFRLPYLLSHGWMICFFQEIQPVVSLLLLFFLSLQWSADLMFLLD